MGKRGGVGLAVALAAASCGGGDLGPMSGQLALPARDIGDLFFWKPRTLGFTRDAADSSQGLPQDLLVWPLDEPAPAVALPGINWWPDAYWPKYRVGDLLLTGPAFDRLYDVGSRQATNLVDFPPLPPRDGVTPDGGIAAERSPFALMRVRSDGQAIARVRSDGRDEIVVGRPPELRLFTIPGGGSVGAISFLGADLAVLLRRATAGGDVVGIYRLDTSSGELTLLVAPTPAAEWNGLAGWCELAPGRCPLFGTIGCDLQEPACPSGAVPPCLIYFAKIDPDDGAMNVAYVHDVNAASTTRLAGANPVQIFANRHLLAWGGFVSTYDYTRYRDLCGAVERECPFLPGDQVAWRPDGGGFAMYDIEGFLRVVNVADGSCATPDPNVTYDTRQASYAPTSDRLMWIAQSDAAATARAVWLADGAGRSPVAIASGGDLRAQFSPDGRTVYVRHDDEPFALGWFDPAASPPVETFLSTNRGPSGVLGNRRALFIDHYNAQDASGELVLVELATGARQTLARAVTDVAVPRATDEPGTDVAYAVRARASSSRDGLWLTTLPP